MVQGQVWNRLGLTQTMKMTYKVTTKCCLKGTTKMTQKETIKKINAQTKKLKKENARRAKIYVESDGLHTIYKGKVIAK